MQKSNSGFKTLTDKQLSKISGGAGYVMPSDWPWTKFKWPRGVIPWK